MKTLILLASAAMFAATAPAAAQHGNGHGNGNGNGHGNAHQQGNGHGNGNGGEGRGHGNWDDAAVSHGNSAHARNVHGNSNNEVIRTRSGRLYAMDRRGSCPPGLAKKNNGCLPPGQAKKLYNVGQRYNRNFGSAWTYDQIPSYLRNQYGLDQSDRYYYNNGYLYQVDPKTMLVQQAISALLR